MATPSTVSPSALPTSGASWILLALYVAVTATASLTGSLASDPDTSAWYQALNQPSFQPPSWAFGVVWPILYLMMAYAGWRADAAAKPDQTRRLRVAYGVQLLFNAGWTIVFFALQSIIGGFVVILGLLAAILTWMALARQVDRLSFWLFAPYVAWVAFATLLNGSYVLLN